MVQSKQIFRFTPFSERLGKKEPRSKERACWDKRLACISRTLFGHDRDRTADRWWCTHTFCVTSVAAHAFRRAPSTPAAWRCSSRDATLTAILKVVRRRAEFETLLAAGERSWEVLPTGTAGRPARCSAGQRQRGLAGGYRLVNVFKLAQVA